MTQAAASQLEQQLRLAMTGTIFGLDDIIHSICIALIARGHVLLEGVPGVGKTLMGRVLAKVLGTSFKRIQCTADLMPSDMTGVQIYNDNSKSFELVPGPLFAEIVLVDEINRTGPKTQSAMLQAMEERSIAIDRETYRLPDNFMVIATQNPFEFEGTFPLPESQIDRFLMRLEVSYLDELNEIKVLKNYDKPSETMEQKLDLVQAIPDNLLSNARQHAAEIHLSDDIYHYMRQLAHASRNHQFVDLGLSTRGLLALARCARSESALCDSEFVSPDHIKTVAPYVLNHRLTLTQEATLEGVLSQNVIADILDSVPVPRD